MAKTNKQTKRGAGWKGGKQEAFTAFVAGSASGDFSPTVMAPLLIDPQMSIERQQCGSGNPLKSYLYGSKQQKNQSNPETYSL